MFSLRFNLGHQKTQLTYLESFMEDVRERRYQPFYDDGPANYNPYTTTHLDVEREIFEEIENANALYFFERFKNQHSRLFRLYNYIDAQCAFDFAYKDDLLEPLCTIRDNHKKFQRLRKVTQKACDLYHSQWLWLEEQGRLHDYRSAHQSYKETLEDYRNLQLYKFSPVLSRETPQSLVALFKIYDREDLKDIVKGIQIDLDRAMFLSKQMRFMYRCLGDGVLENDEEGYNFTKWCRRNIGEILSPVRREINRVEQVVNYGRRSDPLPEIPPFQLSGPV